MLISVKIQRYPEMGRSALSNPIKNQYIEMIIKLTFTHVQVCVNVDFGWPNPRWLIEAGRRCYRNYNCFENSPFPARQVSSPDLARIQVFEKFMCLCVYHKHTHPSEVVSMWEWCSFFSISLFSESNRDDSLEFDEIWAFHGLFFFVPSYLWRGVWFTAFWRLNVPYFDCRSIDYVIYRIICSGNL